MSGYSDVYNNVYNIIDPGLNFNGKRIRRISTEGIILHHSDSQSTVYQIHSYHKSRGWIGIGYNFYIYKVGTIFSGRGLEYVGAHTTNFNSKTIGICCQGQYDSVDRTMPDEQFNALIWLIRYCRDKYGSGLYINGHKEFNNTACPGRYFPLAEVKKLVFRSDVPVDSNGCPYGISTATVKNGTTGMVVKRCQWYLNRAIDAGLDIDGIAGQKTETAIKNFQKKNGLAVDGICGAKTWQKLVSVVEAQNKSNDTKISKEEVKEAIAILHEATIINTPAYWEANYNKLKYLDLLLVKLATYVQDAKVMTVITSVPQAAERLALAGAIETPQYWIENYSKVKYLDELLIKAAEAIVLMS